MPSIRLKGREPQALPVEQILRHGQGDPRADGRKRRVSHHIVLERFDKRDARILAATAAVGPPLVISFRLQCNAKPLDSARIAGFVELYAGNADARIIALRDKPWKQVKLTVRATNGSRIQDAFDLLRVARLRLHDQPQTLQLKATHRFPSQSHAADRRPNRR